MTAIRTTMAAAISVGLLLSPTASAAAATAADETPVAQEVWVSTDGVSFSRGSDALFSDAQVLVPGDEVWATVWVKNGADIPAQMRTSVRDLQASSTAFTDALTLDFIDADDQTTWSGPVGELADCTVLGPSRTVAAGETVSFEVGMRMADVDGTESQNEALDFEMVVAMRDAAAGAFPSTACEDEGVTLETSPTRPASDTAADTDLIAYTGAVLPLPAFFAAGALLGIGGFFVLASRRRRRA